MITLREFIRSARGPQRGNAWVEEPGFASLYVRYGRRLLGGVWYADVLDIANVTTDVSGQSTFTRLIAALRTEYPAMSLYVESVLADEFARYLERTGWTSVRGVVASYYLLGTKATPRA